jgi:hypothetical protein
VVGDNDMPDGKVVSVMCDRTATGAGFDAMQMHAGMRGRRSKMSRDARAAWAGDISGNKF